MGISDFHASTIIKVEANFGFHDFICSPNDITSHLGIEPDEIMVKGTPKSIKMGTEITTPFNSWSIASSHNSKDINEHIRELLLRLETAKAPFLTEWGEPSFGVLWKGNYLYTGSGPFYEPDVILGISKLKAALYQDIYQIDDEND